MIYVSGEGVCFQLVEDEAHAIGWGRSAVDVRYYAVVFARVVGSHVHPFFVLCDVILVMREGFVRHADCGDDHQRVSQFVEGVEDVRVPVEGRVFEGYFTNRGVVNGVFNLSRGFQGVHFAMTRYVAVWSPHLAA